MWWSKNKHKHNWGLWSDLIEEKWHQTYQGHKLKGTGWKRRYQERTCTECGKYERKYIK